MITTEAQGALRKNLEIFSVSPVLSVVTNFIS
jgi:hypothetical protein